MHKVEDELASGKADLVALPLELADRLLDAPRRAGARPAAVEHPVDRGEAQPGLQCDVFDQEGTRHRLDGACGLMCF